MVVQGAREAAGSLMPDADEAVRLEHRLTKLEEAVVANTLATSNVVIQSQAIVTQVKVQNGRIGKLEKFQAQLLVLAAAATFISPTIFFLLTRRYG